MAEPIITIVIPVYNRRELVGRTLASVAAQTLRPLRVILVDNNSTDGSADVLRRWKTDNESTDFVIDVISETKPGAAAARNAGLRLVQSAWTMFFDSDDVMSPDHAERVVREIASHPSADLIGWDVRIHDLAGASVIKPFAARSPLFHCIMHGSLATQRYAAKTALFRQAGGWDESVEVWNDIELGARLCSQPALHIAKMGGGISVDVYSTPVSITGTDLNSKGAQREHSLDCIASAIAPSLQIFVNLKRAILAANYAREGAKDAARRLLDKALVDTAALSRRMMLRFAYVYTAMGLRGAARLLEPFMPKA